MAANKDFSCTYNELQTKVTNYIQDCKDPDNPTTPSIPSLAIALDIPCNRLEYLVGIANQYTATPSRNPSKLNISAEERGYIQWKHLLEVQRAVTHIRAYLEADDSPMSRLLLKQPAYGGYRDRITADSAKNKDVTVNVHLKGVKASTEPGA